MNTSLSLKLTNAEKTSDSIISAYLRSREAQHIFNASDQTLSYDFEAEEGRLRTDILSNIEACNYSEAMLLLHQLCDCRNHIYWHIDRNTDQPLIIRDNRSRLQKPSHFSEPWLIIFLSHVRGALKLLELEPHSKSDVKAAQQELINLTNRLAPLFFQEKYKKKGENLFQQAMDVVVEHLANHLHLPSMSNKDKSQEAKKRLIFIRDFLSLEDTHFHIATLSHLKATDANKLPLPQTFCELDIGLFGLTEVQKQYYQNQFYHQEAWYLSLPNWKKSIIDTAAEKILQEKHLPPTQFRAFFPTFHGMRNPYKRRNFLVTEENTLTIASEFFHSGTATPLLKFHSKLEKFIAFFTKAGPKESYPITEENLKQLQEYITPPSSTHSNRSSFINLEEDAPEFTALEEFNTEPQTEARPQSAGIIHVITLNSPSQRSDEIIINVTNGASKAIGAYHSNIPINSLRVVSDPILEGFKATLHLASRAIPDEYNHLKSYLAGSKNFIDTIVSAFSKNTKAKIQKDLENLLSKENLLEQERQFLLITFAFVNLLENFSKRSLKHDLLFMGSLSTAFSQHIRELKESTAPLSNNKGALLSEYLEKVFTLTSCKSGKDRTGAVVIGSTSTGLASKMLLNNRDDLVFSEHKVQGEVTPPAIKNKQAQKEAELLEKTALISTTPYPLANAFLKEAKQLKKNIQALSKFFDEEIILGGQVQLLAGINAGSLGNIGIKQDPLMLPNYWKKSKKYLAHKTASYNTKIKTIHSSELKKEIQDQVETQTAPLISLEEPSEIQAPIPPVIEEKSISPSSLPTKKALFETLFEIELRNLAKTEHIFSRLEEAEQQVHVNHGKINPDNDYQKQLITLNHASNHLKNGAYNPTPERTYGIGINVRQITLEDGNSYIEIVGLNKDSPLQHNKAIKELLSQGKPVRIHTIDLLSAKEDTSSQDEISYQLEESYVLHTLNDVYQLRDKFITGMSVQIHYSDAQGKNYVTSVTIDSFNGITGQKADNLTLIAQKYALTHTPSNSTPAPSPTSSKSEVNPSSSLAKVNSLKKQVVATMKEQPSSVQTSFKEKKSSSFIKKLEFGTQNKTSITVK